MQIKYKIYCLAILTLLISYQAKSQQEGSVGIGTTIPDNNAILDISSTDKGLLIPRLTELQRNTLQAPAQNNQVIIGLLIYNTTTQKFNYWNGYDWQEMTQTARFNSGNAWYVGASSNTSTAEKDDYYLDDGGNYQQKGLTGWNYLGSLKGQQGTGTKVDVLLPAAPALTVPANGSFSQTFQVNGVQLGDAVSVSVDPSQLVSYQFGRVSVANASVTALGVVSVSFINNSGNAVTIPPGTTFTFTFIR